MSPGSQRSPSLRLRSNAQPGSSCENVFGGDVEAGDDARRLRQDDAARAQLGRHDRLGRHVAPAEILGQRAADDLAIERRIERLKRDRSHAASLLRAARFRRLPSVDDRPSSAARRIRRRAPGSGRRRARSASRRVSSARSASGRRTIARSTAVFSGRCSSLFFLRIAPSTVGGELERRARRRRLRRRRRRTVPSAVGQAAACTDPGCHHDHTSSVTNGRYGAKQPLQQRRERREQRGVRRSGRRLAEVAVAARLHQLEIVVAEEPEERLGVLQHPGVVVVLELAAVASRTSAADDRQQAASTGCGDVGRAARVRPSTNFDALSSLIDSRRPTFICAGSNAVSVPGRALAAQ